MNTDTRLRERRNGRRKADQLAIRPQRAPCAHAHPLDAAERRFRAQLGILGRNYQPDTRGPHGNVQYKFWPTDAAIDSWGPSACSPTRRTKPAPHVRELSAAMLLDWSGDSGWSSVPTRSESACGPGLCRPHEQPRLRAARLVDGDGNELFTKSGFYFVRRRHHDQPRARAGRGARARRRFGAQILPVASHGAVAGRHELSVHPTRRSRRRATNFRESDRAQPLELPVHEGGSVRFIAQLEKTNRAVNEARARRNLNFDMLSRRDQSVVGALRGVQHESSNYQLLDSGQRTEIVPTEEPRGTGAVLREVLLSIAAVAHGSFAGPARTSV